MLRIILGVIGLSSGILLLEGLRPVPIVVAQVKKDAPKGRKIAVLVGVNQYTNRPYENLRYAERDMERLKEVLEWGGFEVVMLLGSAKGNDEATQKNINDLLFDKSEKNKRYLLRDVTENDTVLIALSGQGEQIQVKVGGKETEVPFFCPKNAETGNPSTLISINSILEALDQKKPTSLVLVDACRKFVKPVEGKKSGASMDRAKVQSLRDGIGVMFASSDRQETVESTNVGGGHGLFFYGVLEAIKSATPNKQGQIVWEQLVPQIRTKVSEASEYVGVAERDRQRPQYIGNFSKDIVICAATKETIKMVDFEYVTEGKKLKSKCEVMEIDYGGGIKMEFVKIKKGKFMMGSPKEEKDRDENETQKEVEIKADFWMGRYEVTQAQYKAMMGENLSRFKGDKLPVEKVSFENAKQFCDKLNEKVNKKFSLPSEAQWEYACRAGTKTPFHFGTTMSSGLANYNDMFQSEPKKKNKTQVRTTDVGSFPANPWGLFDMHGNVIEWCTDWYDADKKQIVVRGGSWVHNPDYCRSAKRGYNFPLARVHDIGFRVCFPVD